VQPDEQRHCDAYVGGSGSPLVLLHGLGGTWHIWKPVLALLEKQHRVIALTLPGHHGGPGLPAGAEVTVESVADALIAELNRRGLHSAHVAGNSLGGWLALELARRGFARSVVALSPAGAWRSRADYRAVSLPFRVFYFLMPLILLITTLFLGSAWLRRALGRQTMEYGDRIESSEFRSSLVAFTRTRILPGLLETMGRDGPIAPLSAAGTAIRIAWCGLDRVIPFERYGRPMLERVPQAECIQISAVGHVPMYDDPLQVASAILEVTTAADTRPAAAVEACL